MCYPTPEGHLTLSLPHIKTWNRLIKAGQATVEECPPLLIMEIRQEQARHQNSRKTAPETSIGWHGMNGSGMPFIYNYYGAGGVPQGGGFFPPFSQQGPTPKAPRSSPPQRDGDDDSNLIKYFN